MAMHTHTLYTASQPVHDTHLSPEPIPTLFVKQRPHVVYAYYTGPWLPMSYAEECARYTFSLEYPLQILEIAERRATLEQSLHQLTCSAAQLPLFAAERTTDMSTLLDDLLSLSQNRRPLYKRWSQTLGEKKREFAVPQKALETLLRDYVLDIIKLAPCHPQCHGGEKGWSVIESLASHLPLGTVLSFDLEEAFKNVDIQYVFDFFYRLSEDRLPELEIRRDFAGFLTTLCTVYYKDKHVPALPQGSPVTMALFNRLLYPIDELLHASARKRHLRYTRWVDDFIISAPEPNRRPQSLYGSVSVVRKDFPVHLGKVFLQQGVPEYYLLGHKILGDEVIKVQKEQARNRGQAVPLQCLANQYELDNWIFDYEWEDNEGRLDF